MSLMEFRRIKMEGPGWAGEGVRADAEYFRLIAVEFEKVLLHPWFDISDTGGVGGVGDWGGGDGLVGEVELSVVSVAVDVEGEGAASWLCNATILSSKKDRNELHLMVSMGLRSLLMVEKKAFWVVGAR